MSNNTTSQYIVYAQTYAAKAGFPQQVVLEKITEWRQQLNYTSDELSLYLSLYYYQIFVQFCRVNTQQVMRFVMSILGLLGYILEMAVLMQPEFNTISFSYFKAITAYEAVVMIYLIRKSIFAFIPTVTSLISSDPMWAWFDIVCLYALGEPQSFAADTLTMFVSLERVVAMWFPTKFQLVNNVKFAVFAQITSCFAGAIYWANFTSFSSDARGFPVKTDPLETNWASFFLVKDIVAQIRGWIVLALAIAVTAGFCRMAVKVKRRNRVDRDDIVSRKMKLNKQLALLSMACSIPVTIQAVMDLFYNDVIGDYLDLDAAIISLPFDDAVKNAQHATSISIFTLFDGASYLLSHCTHFYANFLLSQRFRSGTLKMLRNGRSNLAVCSGRSRVEPDDMHRQRRRAF